MPVPSRYYAWCRKNLGVCLWYGRTAWAIPFDATYLALLLVCQADSVPGMAVGEAIQRRQRNRVVSAGLPVVRLSGCWGMAHISP